MEKVATEEIAPNHTLFLCLSLVTMLFRLVLIEDTWLCCRPHFPYGQERL